MIDPGQVNNYCSISLFYICIISKVLEQVVHNHTIRYLFNSIYGSLPGCSSLQKLDILLQAKERNAVAVVTHLDVHKAFDTVPHQNFGIPRPGNLLRWFQGYLANCGQCVSIINAKQKHLGCKKGEANQKQQLSDYKSIHSYTCD